MYELYSVYPSVIKEVGIQPDSIEDKIIILRKSQLAQKALDEAMLGLVIDIISFALPFLKLGGLLKLLANVFDVAGFALDVNDLAEQSTEFFVNHKNKELGLSSTNPEVDGLLMAFINVKLGIPGAINDLREIQGYLIKFVKNRNLKALRKGLDGVRPYGGSDEAWQKAISIVISRASGQMRPQIIKNIQASLEAGPPPINLTQIVNRVNRVLKDAGIEPTLINQLNQVKSIDDLTSTLENMFPEIFAIEKDLEEINEINSDNNFQSLFEKYYQLETDK